MDEESWAAAAVGFCLPLREVLLMLTRRKSTPFSGLKRKKNVLPSFKSKTFALDLLLCVLSLLFWVPANTLFLSVSRLANLLCECQK